MSDLDTLRPEVREAINRTDMTVEMFDTLVTVNRDDYDIIRAELLRLADERHIAIAELQYHKQLLAVEADLAALKAAGRFAVGVMDAFWSPPDVGSLDGFDLQELAEKHGMLTRFDVPEGGCGEACNCICDGAEPGDDCYRWSETFKRVRTGVEK